METQCIGKFCAAMDLSGIVIDWCGGVEQGNAGERPAGGRLGICGGLFGGAERVHRMSVKGGVP